MVKIDPVHRGVSVKIVILSNTLNPKSIAYSEDVRKSTIETHFPSVANRGVGRLSGMNDLMSITG